MLARLVLMSPQGAPRIPRVVMQASAPTDQFFSPSQIPPPAAISLDSKHRTDISDLILIERLVAVNYCVFSKILKYSGLLLFSVSSRCRV